MPVHLVRRADSGDWQPMLPVAGVLVEGRYRVIGALGQGGMCAVLAARDEVLGREVALKFVLPRMMAYPEVIERFANEARSLARIESRHVIKVLDLGVVSEPEESKGLPFMVLELLRGQDLFAYSAAKGPLPAEQVVRFALEACDGLAAAHVEGIIHRDLKPENLFIAIEPDGSECLKVIDFGIARGWRTRALTQDRGIGSPGYMSPEQVEHASQVDARTDIWSLGVVMYELLAFRAAYVGESMEDLCQKVLDTSLPPLGELCPQLPEALVRVVECCLHRDPEQRFSDVAQLAEALTPLDHWSPISEVWSIRGRLEARPTPVKVQPRRALLLVDTDPKPARLTPRLSRSGRRWRTLSALAVVFTLLPAVAIFPTPLAIPALAPAQAWSADALHFTEAMWSKLQGAARSLWAKHAADTEAHPAPAAS